jgi:D-alanyl-D-alanine carboxypeptidase
MRVLLALLALVAAVTAGAGAVWAKPLPRADRAFVDETVATAMAEGRLPGVAVSITGPKGSYTRTYGVSDLRDQQPVDVDQHVRIASISKTFTATAILRQVERGRIKLSDKLSRWIKGIPNGNRITIRQMLAMRSGIYDYTSDKRFGENFAANPKMKFGLADVLAIIKRHRPLFAPGARTQYADSNYFLLGAILEKVTGMSAEAAITRDVIRPLGLTQSSFPTKPRLPRPFSRGYYAGDDGTGAIEDYTALNPGVPWTAGGMVSTLGDLRKYGRALATGRLLSPRLQRQRLRFGTIPNAGGPPVGYGLGILRVGDWIGHDGAIFGFSTATFYERRSGAQIVATANLSSNFSTPTLTLFFTIGSRLYPASLK